VAPCAISARVASATAALSPRGNSSSIVSARAERARSSKAGSEVTTATWSAVRALDAAASTSRNIASASARRSPGDAPASRVLAKIQLLGGDKNKAHGVSL